ncbi:dehydrodolichyl diphosphate syntase complex subunit nus1 [Quillaja saponaria]|uniref:ditrans,polycis-polyprenyl diphosphate synthase [(2E,6E)-farnesyldiphosphate specific] n=1 Tax=Quillaja saponaria TaxID=32244 RepID=A0AAD7QJY7_QUISA|nr:dehydrodolichyl diphosphate syntase complex subunit nus1 [Quillaja saponaria]
MGFRVVQFVWSGVTHIASLGLQLLWHFLHLIVNMWYSMFSIICMIESYLISAGALKSYKSLYLGKIRHLAIVVDSEDACQTSKIVELLQWLDIVGIRNVCLYDSDGVMKKSKGAILQKLNSLKLSEEADVNDTLHDQDHMTIEFASYVDGKEAVTKAANLIFVEYLKQQNSGGHCDGHIFTESHMTEALHAIGCKGPEPDLLLVYGPVRCHLGFPAWRIRYTEIVHMGPLNAMRYGSLVKAIYMFMMVHQNYGT